MDDSQPKGCGGKKGSGVQHRKRHREAMGMVLDADHSRRIMDTQWAEESAPREKMLNLRKVTVHPGSLSLGS